MQVASSFAEHHAARDISAPQHRPSAVEYSSDSLGPSGGRNHSTCGDSGSARTPLETGSTAEQTAEGDAGRSHSYSSSKRGSDEEGLRRQLAGLRRRAVLRAQD